MKNNHKRRPDYETLYPGVYIPDEVLEFLKKSDRRMEYFAYDLKRDRVRKDRHGRTVRDEDGFPVRLPEREVSLERLIEEDWEFTAPGPLPEDIVAAKAEKEELRRCVNLLTPEERELITASYYKCVPERKLAVMYGLSKTAVHTRKEKNLRKIQKMMGE